MSTDASTTTAEISALIELISSSAASAIAAWDQEAGGVPALDAPVADSTRTGNSPDLLRAVRLLEGACSQLCAVLSPTFISVVNRAWAPLDGACLRIAVDAKIPDVLKGHPDGLHVSAIAEQTGLPPAKLARALRVLSTKHCFREVAKDTFANNRLSHALLAELRLTELVWMFENICNPPAWTHLSEALADPAYGPSDDLVRTAFSWGIREKMPDTPLFKYLAARPMESERFGKAMTAWQLGGVQDFYPVADLPANTTWCDIGGGMGGVLIPVVNKNPQLRGTLQEQPHVVEEAKQNFAKEFPDALRENRVSFVPINFLTESPVPNQDIYYMRMIVHNWPDAACIDILTNVRKVMKPSSRLLVHDYVLISSVAASQGALEMRGDIAPSPLLPNYGAGGVRPFYMDVTMMSMLNAKERSLDDMIELGCVEHSSSPFVTWVERPMHRTAIRFLADSLGLL
ncbi:S-adenosyl-L-methionine-dependent methyltransferase [Dentipellis sp. KUC8613]|nr:S-adenosyl-L-methionine-dependent methyltransferase [Dentipellis sp. KUC8613]